jgi:hypothetical protein
MNICTEGFSIIGACILALSAIVLGFFWALGAKLFSLIAK